MRSDYVVSMIEQGAPRVIENDKELDQYTDALFALTALENPTDAQLKAIKLLTLLVTSYENEHYPLPQADPIDVARYVQEKNRARRDAEIERRVARMFEVASETPRSAGASSMSCWISRNRCSANRISPNVGLGDGVCCSFVSAIRRRTGVHVYAPCATQRQAPESRRLTAPRSALC